MKKIVERERNKTTVTAIDQPETYFMKSTFL